MSVGDNSLDGVTAEQLCGYVSKIERIEKEVQALQDDKSDIFREAKAVGFDVKTLKRLIQRRRKDRVEVQEEDQLLELYEEIIRSILGRPKRGIDPLE